MEIILDGNTTNITVSIITGIFSGVIVAFFIFLLTKIWKDSITPWFEDKVYKDIKIEGKWFGLYPATIEQRQDVIKLKRKGHSIKGKITCINGCEKGEEYYVNGSFRNMVLPLTYETTDRKKTDRGTITFMCKNNGQVLKGKIALYQNDDDLIDTANIIWFRSKRDLEKMMAAIKLKKIILEKIKEEKSKYEKKEFDIETDPDSNVEYEIVNDDTKDEKNDKGIAPIDKPKE